MQSIPSTGTPPEEFYGSGMVYDELTGCLIIFGGSYSVYGTFSNVLYTFDISVLEWGVLNPESNFLPSPIGSPIVFLTKERILYAMCGINEKGFNSDIFSYNLTSKIWKLVENDIVVPGLSYTVNTQFEWNGKDYIAIFAGFTSEGWSNSLYL